MRRRSRLLLALALAMTASACTPEATSSTPTTAASTSTSSEASTSSSSSTTTTSPAPTGPLPGTEGLTPEMQQQISDLVDITEELRGIEFLQPPVITVVTSEELEQRVREQFFEENEDIPADEALLELLGLIEPDVDLLALYRDLYGEQVGGYYDGETGELVVPAGESLSVLQRGTLVHELVHALTDQRFGSSGLMNDLIDDDRFDEALALLSVSEGDATLTEILYIQRLPLADQQEFLRETFSIDSSVLDSAPAYLQHSLLFPYQEGLAFVQRSWELGGFDEVNRLYVEPPVSTEQIITPRDYQRDEPIRVEIVAPTLSGYELVYESVWGQLGFVLMFEEGVGGAEAAADGWGGDGYLQWFDGTEAALLIDYVGDTEADGEELASVLLAYVASTMAVGEAEPVSGGVVHSGDDFAFVGRSGARVVFVAAGDPDIGRQIVEAVSLR